MKELFPEILADDKAWKLVSRGLDRAFWVELLETAGNLYEPLRRKLMASRMFHKRGEVAPDVSGSQNDSASFWLHELEEVLSPEALEWLSGDAQEWIVTALSQASIKGIVDVELWTTAGPQYDPHNLKELEVWEDPDNGSVWRKVRIRAMPGQNMESMVRHYKNRNMSGLKVTQEEDPRIEAANLSKKRKRWAQDEADRKALKAWLEEPQTVEDIEERKKEADRLGFLWSNSNPGVWFDALNRAKALEVKSAHVTESSIILRRWKTHCTGECTLLIQRSRGPLEWLGRPRGWMIEGWGKQLPYAPTIRGKAPLNTTRIFAFPTQIPDPVIEAFKGIIGDVVPIEVGEETLYVKGSPWGDQIVRDSKGKKVRKNSKKEKLAIEARKELNITVPLDRKVRRRIKLFKKVEHLLDVYAKRPGDWRTEDWYPGDPDWSSPDAEQMQSLADALQMGGVLQIPNSSYYGGGYRSGGEELHSEIMEGVKDLIEREKA